ncbi:MAG: response regulator [Candidatus Abyssobacteria bacterium SURF_5]|uniref:Response regulator n=1 Tax=Abyssobacteria bacterium (strain SURF_5) TaxID=2093360 RepID=A0A3A4NH85_ABYX5|nr:MAG: response regulator [Candidatus Abyssubacteria bacterium SURF_5]
MKKKGIIQVLIVDDEDRFRSTTKTNLEKRGFEVRAAATGAEAIEEIRRDEVDVVVLDVKMPGMDGNEVLHRMKALKPDLEVIMLTGHGTMRSALIAFRDEVFEYLSKPCDTDTLADTIRNAAAHKTGSIHGAEWYSIWSKAEPGSVEED